MPSRDKNFAEFRFLFSAANFNHEIQERFRAEIRTTKINMMIKDPKFCMTPDLAKWFFWKSKTFQESTKCFFAIKPTNQNLYVTPNHPREILMF